MKLSIVLSTQQAQFQAATFKGDLESNLARIASSVMTALNLPYAIPGWWNWKI